MSLTSVIRVAYSFCIGSRALSVLSAASESLPELDDELDFLAGAFHWLGFLAAGFFAGAFAGGLAGAFFATFLGGGFFSGEESLLLPLSLPLLELLPEALFSTGLESTSLTPLLVNYPSSSGSGAFSATGSFSSSAGLSPSSDFFSGCLSPELSSPSPSS